MDGYKDRKTIGHSTVEDEYRGTQDLYDQKKNRPNGSDDAKYGKLAETDHIVPLKQIHDEFKHNYALDDDDIKRIANADYNFATTAAEINDGRGKGALSNKEFIEKMRENGTPLDKQTEENMLRLQKEAEKEIDKQANSLIAHNLFGMADQKAIDAKYDAMLESKIKQYEKKHGTKPTEEKLAKMKETVENKKNSELEEYKTSQKSKAKEISKNNARMAAKQAADYAVGNVILFVIKPIYYEMTDIFKNGMQEGVGASSTTEALKIRFGRIKTYMLDHAGEFIGDNIGEFIKGFVSSLVECIISLFVGVFKQVLKDSLNTIPDDKDLATEDSGDASMETEKPEKTDVSEDISANTAQEEAPIQALNLSDYLDNPYMSIYWDQLDMLDRSSGVVWYSVYDMDADGIPELFVSVGESYNQKGELYTIKGENATYLGSFDGNTVLYVDPEDGKVVAVYGYMGTEVLTYLTKSPAGLTIAKQPYRELEPDEDYYETPYPIECNWTADDEVD